MKLTVAIILGLQQEETLEKERGKFVVVVNGYSIQIIMNKDIIDFISLVFQFSKLGNAQKHKLYLYKYNVIIRNEQKNDIINFAP